MTDLAFAYDDLWYLKARGPNDKRPLESWGGYAQDFNDAPLVYSHDEVLESDHENWLLNSYRSDCHPMGGTLLIFDVDIHKAPESFDVDRVTVPDDTLIVKSQSGGFHVYFIVNSGMTGKESAFTITRDLPGEFDIDIRGEYVKHHVAAPSDIPGVRMEYDIVNDTPIKRVFRASEAARLIQLDGEPLLSHKSGGRVSIAPTGNYQRKEIDPPQNMPTCYGAGLELRKEAPDSPNINTHKVNVLTALCGVAAGYSVEQIVNHFVDKYYPGDAAHADRERTQYQVSHIAQKYDSGEYEAPSLTTLREYGILPIDETCECQVHGGDGDTSAYYNIDLGALAKQKGINVNPYDNDRALYKTCLHAREEYEALADVDPPYAVLKLLADNVGLPYVDESEGILGETSYEVARRIWDDVE